MKNFCKLFNAEIIHQDYVNDFSELKKAGKQNGWKNESPGLQEERSLLSV